MKKVTILLIIVFTGNTVCSLGGGGNKGQPDPEIVQQKINALGVRDDTRSPKENLRDWLNERRDKIIPELIQGLNSENNIGGAY